MIIIIQTFFLLQWKVAEVSYYREIKHFPLLFLAAKIKRKFHN